MNKLEIKICENDNRILDFQLCQLRGTTQKISFRMRKWIPKEYAIVGKQIILYDYLRLSMLRHGRTVTVEKVEDRCNAIDLFDDVYLANMIIKDYYSYDLLVGTEENPYPLQLDQLFNGYAISNTVYGRRYVIIEHFNDFTVRTEKNNGETISQTNFKIVAQCRMLCHIDFLRSRALSEA